MISNDTTPRGFATVPVKPASGSKIVWTQIVGIAAVLATNFFGVEIPAETQVIIVSAIAVGQDLITAIMKIFFTKSVQPSSLS